MANGLTTRPARIGRPSHRQVHPKNIPKSSTHDRTDVTPALLVGFIPRLESRPPLPPTP